MINNWDITVVVLYFVLLIGMGVLLSKLNKDTTDYFIGGRKATWWLVGMSGFVSGISAYTFTGNAGAGYRGGLTLTVIYIGSVVSFIVGALFFAARLRRTRAVTMQEIIRDRYNSATETLYSTVGPLNFVLGSSMGLWAIASFVGSVFGWQIETLIIGIGIVSLVYSFSGGRWAVMATDFVQGVVMVLMTIVITIYCWVKVGGIGGFMEKVSQQGLEAEMAFIKPIEDVGWTGEFSIGWMLAIFLMIMVVQCSLVSGGRFLSNKDEKEASRSSILISIGYALGAIIWFIPPMVARVLYSDKVEAMTQLNAPQEGSYAVVALEVLPNGLIGMLVVAIFAAAMSSLDSGLNGNAAIVVRNLLPKYSRWRGLDLPDDRSQMKLGRTVTVVSGILIIGLALLLASSDITSLFEFGVNMLAILGIPMAVPMVAAVFMERLPPWTAFLSAGMGIIPSLLSFIQIGEWNFTVRTLSILACSVVGVVIGRLCWKWVPAKDKERIREVYRLMEKPIDVEKEVGPLVDFVQLKVVGYGLAVVGGFILMLIALPNTPIDRLTIFLIGGVMLAMGLGMGAYGIRIERAARRLEKKLNETNVLPIKS